MQPSTRRVFLVVVVSISVIALLLHFKWLMKNHDQSETTLENSPNSDNKQFVHVPSISDVKPVLPAPKKFSTNLLRLNLDSPTWDLDSLRDLFFVEVMRVHVKCHKKVRVGREEDGGWDVCMDPGFNPTPPCLVYSFGVGNIWEFDEQMASHYKCTVRAFDPTMGKTEHVHNPGPVYFYPMGLGAFGRSTYIELVKGRLPTLSLLNFLRMFNEQQYVVDVLKIDVEFAEWDALERIIKDGSLGQVKQLMLETHTLEVNKRPSGLEHYRKFLKVLQALEAAGFRKYLATRNHDAVHVFYEALPPSERNNPKHKERSCCYEAYYINTAYRAADRQTVIWS